MRRCLEEHEALAYRPRDAGGPTRHEFPAMLRKLLEKLAAGVTAAPGAAVEALETEPMSELEEDRAGEREPQLLEPAPEPFLLTAAEVEAQKREIEAAATAHKNTVAAAEPSEASAKATAAATTPAAPTAALEEKEAALVRLEAALASALAEKAALAAALTAALATATASTKPPDGSEWRLVTILGMGSQGDAETIGNALLWTIRKKTGLDPLIG